MTRPIRTLLCCALALVSFSAFAASASADVVCVGAGSGCDETYPFDSAGVALAVAAYQATDSQDDILQFAPGTIEFSDQLELADGSWGDLQVVGAGSGKTKLVFDSVAGDNLQLYFDADDGVSGLSIETTGVIPDSRTGLALSGGTAEDISVLMAPGGNTAFSFDSGTECVNCRAKVSGPSIGFHVEVGLANIIDGKAEVYDPDASVHARGISMQSSDSSVNVSRTRLINFNRAIFGYLGDLVVKDSLIDLGDQDGALGLEVDAQGAVNDDAVSVLDGVTIVGSGDNQRGITVTSNATGIGSVSSTFSNSLSFLTGTDSLDIYCSRANPVPLNLNIQFSIAETISPAGDCVPSETSIVTGTPLFVDAAAGDYRPAPGSPVIEAGNPGSNDVGRFDLSGGVRYIDGTDLEGSGNIDLGALEYQNYAPNKPVVTATPTTISAGSRVNFSATASDPNGQPLTFSWEFSEGGNDSGSAVINRLYNAPGTFKAKAIASDGSLTTASAWVEVTVLAAPPVPLPLPSVLVGKASGSFKFKKDAKLKDGFAVSSKKPKGASIKVTSDAAVTGRIELYNKTGKKLLKGTQSVKLPQGTSYLTFRGKWNKKKLAAGKYQLGLKLDLGQMPNRISMNVTVAKQGSSGKTK